MVCVCMIAKLMNKRECVCEEETCMYKNDSAWTLNERMFVYA